MIHTYMNEFLIIFPQVHCTPNHGISYILALFCHNKADTCTYTHTLYVRTTTNQCMHMYIHSGKLNMWQEYYFKKLLTSGAR